MRMLGFMALLLLPMGLKAEEPQLKVELVSEVTSIKAGETFFVGLHLEHPEGAHTYWKHPGIVGLATSVEWELPAGFTAGEIQWPAPQVVMMAGHKAQGYEGETLLMVPITPPEEINANSATLTVKASWMCCGKTCQPAFKVPFSITLPVRAHAEIDPEFRLLFGKSRSLLPTEGASWQAAAKRDGEKLVLTFKPPGGGEAGDRYRFFTADGQVDSEGEQQVEIQADGTVRMVFIKAEMGENDSNTLPGVVEVTRGGDVSWVEVNPKY